MCDSSKQANDYGKYWNNELFAPCVAQSTASRSSNLSPFSQPVGRSVGRSVGRLFGQSVAWVARVARIPRVAQLLS